MARVEEKDVGPAAFLVDNASEFGRVVVPRCGGLACEALDAAKGGILDSHYIRTRKRAEHNSQTNVDGVTINK